MRVHRRVPDGDALGLAHALGDADLHGLLDGQRGADSLAGSDAIRLCNDDSHAVAGVDSICHGLPGSDTIAGVLAHRLCHGVAGGVRRGTG